MPTPVLTEALLAAAAKTVIGHAAKLVPEDTLRADELRAWLGRVPQQLAFQVALARAFTTFARHHPQWAALLFNEPFLIGPAAPLLARCLVREAPPDPAELVDAWAEQLGSAGAARQQHIADAMPAATDFLRWLEAELRAQPEFQPLLDNHTLDRIDDAPQDSTQAIEALQQELRQASAQAQKYEVTVEQAQGLVVG